jgi:hypothetical protein
MMSFCYVLGYGKGERRESGRELRERESEREIERVREWRESGV